MTAKRQKIESLIDAYLDRVYFIDPNFRYHTSGKDVFNDLCVINRFKKYIESPSNCEKVDIKFIHKYIKNIISRELNSFYNERKRNILPFLDLVHDNIIEKSKG